MTPIGSIFQLSEIAHILDTVVTIILMNSKGKGIKQNNLLLKAFILIAAS